MYFGHLTQSSTLSPPSHLHTVPLPPIKFLSIFYIFENIFGICSMFLDYMHTPFAPSSFPHLPSSISHLFMIFQSPQFWVGSQSLCFFLLDEKDEICRSRARTRSKNQQAVKLKLKFSDPTLGWFQGIIYKHKEIVLVMSTVSQFLRLSLAKSPELGKAVVPESGFSEALTEGKLQTSKGTLQSRQMIFRREDLFKRQIKSQCFIWVG